MRHGHHKVDAKECWVGAVGTLHAVPMDSVNAVGGCMLPRDT